MEAATPDDIYMEYVLAHVEVGSVVLSLPPEVLHGTALMFADESQTLLP